MLGEERNIDRLFKEGLHDFEYDVPEFAWDNIKSGIKTNKEKRKFLPFFLKSIAASITLLLTFTAGYLFNQFTMNKSIYGDAVELDSKNTEIFRNIKSDNNLLAYNQTTIPIKHEKNYKNNNSTIISDIKNYLTNNHDNNLTANTLPESKNNSELNNFKQNQFSFANNKSESNEMISNVNEITNVIEKEKKSKWEVGGLFSPAYSYREIANAGEKEIDLPDNYFDKVENAMMTYSGGVSVEYKSEKRWSIQSGFNYSRMGQVSDVFLAINYSNEYTQQYQVSTSAGRVKPGRAAINEYATNNNIIDASGNIIAKNTDLIQSFDYLEIPLLFKYKVVDRKIDFKLLGGVSTNVLIGNKVYLSTDNKRNSIGKTEDLNAIHYSSTVGVGMQYNILKRLSLNIEPVFKYSLTPINRNNVVAYYPYSFSVITGISYNF